MNIGLIGNGRFGNLLYQTFLKSKIYTPHIYSRRSEPDGEKFLTLEDTIKSDIVIPTVPISYYEEQLKAISNLINKDALIVDVASVKVHTTNAIKKHLTDSVDILSTHPMFGPDSSDSGNNFKNLKFIYWNERIKNKKRADDFLQFWNELGCELIELSPDEHDKQAAYTHAFAFLIGKLGMKMNIRRNYISTKGFEGLLYNQEAVENDTGQLFDDMMNYNPYVKDMIQDAKEQLDLIINETFDE